MLRELRQGLNNLWQWRKIIWHDRWWDYTAISDILEFKLLYMAKKFRSSGMGMNSIRAAERMEMAVRLLRKVDKDDYGMEYIDIIQAKYGKENCIFTSDPDEPELSILTKKFEKNYSAVELQAIERERKALMEIFQKKQEKANRLLWKIFEKYYKTFWD